MSDLTSVAVTFVVIAATAVLTLAVVGLVRIPDTYVKVHAISKAVVLGPLLILAATLSIWELGLILRAVLVATFTVITAAVAGHAIVRLERQRREQSK
ncbi:MAG: monovalent cation/H(+) antiporter subunit G [Alphaproteobacteria bacterium]